MTLYRGPISASKSIFNRVQIIRSFDSNIEIKGFSDCDDVVFLSRALRDINSQFYFNLGEGGTSFRFFMMRISRHSGSFKVSGTDRLLLRPQQELAELLNQLGVETQRDSDSYQINSIGWQRPQGPIFVSQKQSSQFLSALLLSSWNLDFELVIKMKEAKKEAVSDSYLQMTLQVLRDFGMNIIPEKDGYRIPPRQKPKVLQYSVEPDMSSVFALAACAVFKGDLEVTDFPITSVQPDYRFLDILRKMGVAANVNDGILFVPKTNLLKPIKVDLLNNPDLFPVLSVLAAHANGVSELLGAPHLAHKESDRLLNTKKLLSLIGCDSQIKEHGISIKGPVTVSGTNSFDPDQDHRMAMAAAVAKAAGHSLNISHSECVNKSFPEFWKLTGVQP